MNDNTIHGISNRRSIIYSLLVTERPPWFHWDTKRTEQTKIVQRYYKFNTLPPDVIIAILRR